VKSSKTLIGKRIENQIPLQQSVHALKKHTALNNDYFYKILLN
jgi:hypothetical protein